MPLTRYQIRNEFNLADPDLYTSADKDDPEALLEGVAMAGFVGLLRQLGDLAEFAAEVFHDLHEEVMATTARGHGLMTRIQLLEADVPLIERKLLSKTNHTTFYYNTGVDWHPQMCTDQNLITQGDMPRFIRDSYEECRGPPQLFLLDKFDIGGAGACLKRYTDPSSFKAEPATSEVAKLGILRDRRTRKIKKKNSQWRSEGTPDVLTTSHAKLHQLLLEERIVTDSKDSVHQVKLKRRNLDCSRSSKSYMDKFLQSMSHEHSPEIVVGHPILRLAYDHTVASEHEMPDILPVSASESFSPTGQEMKLRPSTMYSYDFSKSRRNKGSSVGLKDGNTNRTASPLQIPVAEKELGADSENRNGIVFPYYDSIGNETENYMDALANMESEPDTDTEYMPKKELRNFSKHADVYDSKQQVLDSRSVDNSIISDDGSISFIKGMSTSSSHGALPNDEHGDREVVIVDYDETEKTFSNGYLKAIGETVGSAAVPYDYQAGDVSYQKGYNLLLQSSESGLSSRQLTSTGEYYKTAPSEATYDSNWPQLVKTGVNAGTVETSDGPGRVDNLSVIRASIEVHESEVPSEILTHSSENFSHDHPKLNLLIDYKGLQKEHVDEFSNDNLADKEFVSPQSATNTQLMDLGQSYQFRDQSHLIPTGSDITDSYHVPVSNDATYANGENMDGYNHVLGSTELEVENSAPALPEVAYVNGGLYTTKSELGGTELLSKIDDNKRHESSDDLLIQRVHEDDVALESGSGSNYDFGQAVLSTDIYSLSGNNNNGEAVLYQADSVTDQFGNDGPEEVDLEGTPPLPPQPPMQWMVGKLQPYFLDDEGESAESIMMSNGSLPPFAFGAKASFDITPLDGDTKQPLKATEPDESSQDSSRHSLHALSLPTDSTLQVTDSIEEDGQHSLLESDKILTDSFTVHPETRLEISQSDALTFCRETPIPSSESCLHTSSTNTNALTIEDVQSCYTPQLDEMTTHTKEIVQPKPAERTILSAGESILSTATRESPQPPLGNKIVSEYNVAEVPVRSTDQSLEESISCSGNEHEPQSFEKNIMNPPEGLGLLIKDVEHRKKEMISSERVASWSLALLNYEDEKLAEKPAIKPPRPRNPLIESVDALDRSKLKKVTPQDRPKTPPPVDERGSLLEQIRAKSFNLKPALAPVAKPIIQAPTMNLKVAAILEKANKIRRATAGSDEDEEDDWSDD